MGLRTVNGILLNYSQLIHRGMMVEDDDGSTCEGINGAR